MNRDLSRQDVKIGAPADRPETKWIIWTILSGASLALVLVAVVVFGVDPGLLLGWVVGIIVAAMLMVFSRG